MSSSEIMVLLNFEKIPGRNSSKQNTTRKRYTDLGGSGGLYNKKFHNKRKVWAKTGRRGAPRRPHMCQARPEGPPAPGAGVVPSGLHSILFTSRYFSYFLKTVKIKAGRKITELFLLELLPIPNLIQQFSEFFPR